MAPLGCNDADLVRSELAKLDAECQSAREAVRLVFAPLIAALEDRQQKLIAQIDDAHAKRSEFLSGLLNSIADEAAGAPASSDDSPDLGCQIDVNILESNADSIMSMSKRLGVVTVTEGLSHANSFAKGGALDSSVTGKPARLLVHSCSHDGKARAKGGDKVVVTADTPGLLEDVRICDLKDGRYMVDFTPTRAGKLNLRVSLGAAGKLCREIQGSPFPLDVKSVEQHQQKMDEARRRDMYPGGIDHERQRVMGFAGFR